MQIQIPTTKTQLDPKAQHEINFTLQVIYNEISLLRKIGKQKYGEEVAVEMVKQLNNKIKAIIID